MWTFIKFNVVGASNTLVDLAVFFTLVHVGVSPGWAQVLGYACGILNSFAWNRGWTFGQGHVTFGAPRFWLFVAVNGAVLGLSTGWVLGATALGATVLVAKLSSFALTLPCSYFGSKWAMRPRPEA